MSETYLDNAMLHKKGPSKPPLPHQYSNLLDSIPNSVQLASIANAALQSVMHIPETPPPPPLHLLQPAPDSNPNPNPNVFATLPTPQSICAGPPGLPLPPSTASYPKTLPTASSSNSVFSFSATNIPNLSPSPIPLHFPQHSNQLLNHINNTSAHHLLSTPSANTVDSHSDVAPQSHHSHGHAPQPQQRSQLSEIKKLRQRNKRVQGQQTVSGGKQTDEQPQDEHVKDKECGSRGHGQHELGMHGGVRSEAKMEEEDEEEEDEEEEDGNCEDICIVKRNLINAIELERRNHELTKLRLIQLHKYFGEMIKDLKHENLNWKAKVAMYTNVPSQTELESVLKQKEEMRNQYLRKKSMRMKDEEQIKQTQKENQKLVIIIHYLRQQLLALEQQYQTLCRQQFNVDGEIVAKQPGFTEAERIVNTLDSLDIVDAESMISSELQLEPAPHFPLYEGTDIAQQISDDPWFQKIIEENKMLERHIRFMKHIMEQETQRCNFREIIVGKQLLSPSKEKEKQKEKDKEEEDEDEEKQQTKKKEAVQKSCRADDGDEIKTEEEKLDAVQVQPLQCDEKKAESE